MDDFMKKDMTSFVAGRQFTVILLFYLGLPCWILPNMKSDIGIIMHSLTLKISDSNYIMF